VASLGLWRRRLGGLAAVPPGHQPVQPRQHVEALANELAALKGKVVALDQTA
jgi:hypothetical protein